VRRGGIKTPYCWRMEKWEYLTAPLLIHNTKMILDTFGDDGWELVTVLSGQNSEQLVAYFKRKKEQ
jgi:hypothetical protein